MATPTTQLGRYLVTKRIGAGGMAEILRGFTYDADGFRREVAIKRVLPNLAQDERFVAMLTDEFRLVSHLRHGNISEVYELVEVAGHLLVAMEYVDGKDMHSNMVRSRRIGIPIGFADSAYILARVLDGLHHAHEASDRHGEALRLVHRDVSPSNILVSYDGQVKLCDFGIAKARYDRLAPSTRAGIIKGKVRYMSPEQASGRPLDRRSDLYSVGSVLYELVTGRTAYRPRKEMALVRAVRRGEVLPIRERRTDIPEHLARIVERAMSRSRSDRFSNALEFRDELLSFLHNEAPDYRRSRLSNWMRSLWEREIEGELRELEDYVLENPPTDEYGRNLIADALGPAPAFERFKPMPPRRDQAAEAGELDVHSVPTLLLDAGED